MFCNSPKVTLLGRQLGKPGNLGSRSYPLTHNTPLGNVLKVELPLPTPAPASNDSDPVPLPRCLPFHPQLHKRHFPEKKPEVKEEDMNFHGSHGRSHLPSPWWGRALIKKGQIIGKALLLPWGSVPSPRSLLPTGARTEL